MPSPNQAVNDRLNSLTAIDGSDVWAVGQYNGSQYNLPRTLIEHWDGSAWSIIPSQDDGTASSLSGVTAVGPGDIWAVGLGYTSEPNFVGGTLVEHYSSCPNSSPTPTPTLTPTFVPPPCPGERFTDVCPPDYFYTAVLALNDDHIVSGYFSSPPCRNVLWLQCFLPYNSSTRGQISKVMALAAGFNDPVSGQTFQDVPPGSTFYTYIEQMVERGIVTGYPCGTPNTPCIPPDNLPYFRVNRHITRGQLSKMVSLAFGWNEPISGQTFQDVPPGSTFYDYIERLYARGVINGYPCGNPSTPCIPPGNLPYFRPSNDVTRGQTTKIVQLARTQPTATPTPTSTAIATATLAAVATISATSVPTATLPAPLILRHRQSPLQPHLQALRL